MDKAIGIIVGFLIMITAYFFGRWILGSMFGWDKKIVSERRWETFVWQFGEVALAVVLVLLAVGFYVFFKLVFGE